MQIRGMLVTNGTRKIVRFNRDKVHEMHRLIDCASFDVVGDGRFHFWVDDDGLLRDRPPCLYLNRGHPLVGNVLITRAGARHASETESLTDDDVAFLENNLIRRTMVSFGFGQCGILPVWTMKEVAW